MIIGMTGGIASGKSTVARAFGQLGIGWVDADDVAREVVKPGTPALADIVARYGSNILNSDGSLDRAALRAIVFADPEQRRWLESVTHPRIRARIVSHLRELQLQGSPYVLLVSPLLFESGQSALVDRTLVIDIPERLQISRTTARDNVDEAQAKAILAAQMSRQERLSRADDVIVNDGDLASLEAQVRMLDQRYRQLASDNVLPNRR
ncbi:dephospho-CoA kinase [Halomonas binhaiensis]|uniref:Dephospho-CoA kinase n=1 Tax=Halomonas binhaiensis TaxID=2562282 RepID=A0A5C1NJN3_9GAMM|nr:dephospho-CoA kinase [Halomonas binhaiensis]QEM82009.1 dephospho-CoA kinase [Halomonas binhaiensis]